MTSLRLIALKSHSSNCWWEGFGPVCSMGRGQLSETTHPKNLSPSQEAVVNSDNRERLVESGDPEPRPETNVSTTKRYHHYPVVYLSGGPV